MISIRVQVIVVIGASRMLLLVLSSSPPLFSFSIAGRCARFSPPNALLSYIRSSTVTMLFEEKFLCMPR